jgi:hypothetical protein
MFVPLASAGVVKVGVPEVTSEYGSPLCDD